MARCFVAFGGNLGPVAETFRAATMALDNGPAGIVVERSRLYRTAPIGASGTAYVNAVAAMESSLSPEALLAVLQAIEDRFGRTRTTHWGPRTLDLDLICCGDVVSSSHRLTIPHPHCWYRRFVLDPWSDVAPSYVHPLLGEPVAELRRRIMARPLRVAVDRDLADVLDVCTAFPDVRIVDADTADAAIVMTRNAFDGRRRCIDLRSAVHRAAIAEHVLLAALDEPIVIAADDWTSEIGEPEERAPSH
jgi:2-amino-4-hydroxy-6-hydroxymethyldihydropteridine diphosphokinase